MSSLHRGALTAAAVLVASLAASGSADAHVRHEGKWPDSEKNVTLDVAHMPRTDAIRKVAEAAGWSLVVHAPPGDPVDIHVKDQPASKVLDILLDDGDYVATRDGTLVSIARDTGAEGAGAGVPPVPPVPPIPPIPAIPGVGSGSSSASPPSASASATGAGSKGIKISIGDSSEVDEPHARGEDRTVMGGNVTIAKGERARDVTVFGGNVDVEGEVTGDITVFGGNVRIHKAGRVHGDASVFGGTLTLDAEARIDGDISAVGGTLKRDPAAHVGGDVTVKSGGDDEGDDDADDASKRHVEEHKGFLARAGSSIIDGLRVAASLFVLGTMLLALAGRRMDMLRGEAAVRPMRSLALGVLGTLGAILLFIALCVTIIGAPIAIVGLLLFGFGILAGMSAILSVVGEALLRHKTENPYVHLAAGCGLFVALAAIPWVGHFVITATFLIGVGVLVATRGAGFVPRRNGNGAGSLRPADQSS